MYRMDSYVFSLHAFMASKGITNKTTEGDKHVQHLDNH